MIQPLKIRYLLTVSIFLVFLSGTALAADNSLPIASTDNAIHGFQSINAEYASSILKKPGLLLFFINPSGQPCQQQAQILNANREEIEKRFKIRAVMTTNQADRMFFYRFGVRRLPAILLLNNDGTVFQQFPPGIQSGKHLLEVINQY